MDVPLSLLQDLAAPLPDGSRTQSMVRGLLPSIESPSCSLERIALRAFAFRSVIPYPNDTLACKDACIVLSCAVERHNISFRVSLLIRHPLITSLTVYEVSALRASLFTNMILMRFHRLRCDTRRKEDKVPIQNATVIHRRHTHFARSTTPLRLP